MNNIALFPVQKSNAAFARHGKELHNYNVIPILASAHKTMAGHDLAVLDGGDCSGVVLQADFNEVLNKCDVLYMDSSNFIFKDEDYYEYINIAKEKNIQIVFSRQLKERLKIDGQPTDCCEREGTNCTRLNQLIDIDVPIISIFTMGNENDQGNVELELRRFFLQRGYKISQIGIHEYSKLLDFHIIPSFLFANNIDGKTKRLMFNQYVRRVVKDEKPDLLIIGVPEAIMKYNDKILAGMGDIPCIIQDSIMSDIGIICTCYAPYTEKYFEELSLYSCYRLNCRANYFNISNSMVINDEDNNNKLEHLSLDTKYIVSNMNFGLKEDGVYEVFNSYVEESRKRAFEKMENELLGNCGL